MKIKIGDILKVKPNDALVVVVIYDGTTMAGLPWLKNYWKTKYNLKLPRFFDTIAVNFSSHKKVYEYPKLRKCIKKPLRQKKYRKLFKEEKNRKKVNIFDSKLKRDYSQYLQDKNDERGF